MSNAQKIISEMNMFIDKFGLKTNKLTNQDLIDFIEEKWKEADSEKYEVNDGQIIIARMINEYIQIQDFDNMMRWLGMMDLHSASQKHPDYVHDYYKGECCLRCGNEKKALEYLNRCHKENPEYIFTRAPFCYEFFNRHLEHSKDLVKSEEDDDDLHSVKLEYWKNFFHEESEDFYFEVLDKDCDFVKKLDEKHEGGLRYLRNNQEKILGGILDELLRKYTKLQKVYQYPENDKIDFMPDVKNIKGFSDLLSPGIFYIISVYKDEIPYVGFSFSCSWDREHGLGVMMHKDKIVEFGEADVAFAVDVAEDDMRKN